MSIDELNRAKIPVVKINKNLEKFRGKILFPEKVKMANDLLNKAKLPKFDNDLSTTGNKDSHK